MAIIPLSSSHDRSSFDCGIPSLNEFLQLRATQHGKKGMGLTFAAVEDTPRVLGYHTICGGSVSPNSVPSNLSAHHPVPTILLARLAVDLSVQGQGLGKELLFDALKRAYQISQALGVHAVSVDALNQSAKEFYLKYGFTQLLDDEFHLYMPIKKIRPLFQP